MDLAKIRQKARQEQNNRHLVEESLPSKPELPESRPVHEVASSAPALDDVTPVQDYEVEELSLDLEHVQTVQPSRRSVSRNPLEVILAGREAAGCGENLPLMLEAQADSGQGIYQEFLCFKVSDEVYGVDIMDIKELIKPREVTEIPGAPSFVSGVISLRGVIVPIIDMPDRLGFARETATGRERIIVVRQGESFTGLLVDEIIQVVRIAQEATEAPPTVLEGIDRDFVTGIGRAEGRIFILLNLPNIIDIHLY